MLALTLELRQRQIANFFPPQNLSGPKALSFETYSPPLGFRTHNWQSLATLDSDFSTYVHPGTWII